MPVLGYLFKIGHWRHTHKSRGNLLISILYVGETQTDLSMVSPSYPAHFRAGSCFSLSSKHSTVLQSISTEGESLCFEGVPVLIPSSTTRFPVLSAQEKWDWLLFFQLLILCHSPQGRLTRQTFKEVTQETNQPETGNFPCLKYFGALRKWDAQISLLSLPDSFNLH